MDLDDDETSSIELHPPLQNSSAPRDDEPVGDLAKLQRWQDERMQRRLRGEYESAVTHLAELINESTERPARLVSIRVEGAQRTRPAFLDTLVRPFLDPSHAPGLPPFSAANRTLFATTPDTFGGALQTAQLAVAQLTRTDVFARVEPRLQASRGVFARPGDLELVLRATERGWLRAKTSTEVGAGEGTAGMTVHLRNIFGGGETLEGNVSAGTQTRRAFAATLAAPLVRVDPSVRTHGALALSGVRRDNSSFASASEDAHMLRASVRTQALGRGTHEVAYNAALRVISDLTPTASYSMRLAAGPSTKSSLTHSWVLDTQDDKIQGTRGALTRLSHELAGGPLGGDAAFYKAEGEYQLCRRVPHVPGMTWSFGARAGALVPLLGRPTLFPDRFQLGGPTNVRLFRASSMGPRDGTDSLGGDTYWAAGLGVVSDLPRKPHWPVKAHAFVNAGRLDARDPGKTLAQNAKAMLAQPSVSVGLGLVYRFDWIRVEANFGVPLAAAASDGARKGFQVGMGVDFL